MINIIHTPPTFSPVYTDGLFFTVSADTNHFKFRYVYNIFADGNLIFEGKATPNPYGLGVIDVSRILRTYVKNEPISLWNNTPIYTHETFPFSRPYQDETINYQLYVGYEYASSDIAPVSGFTGSGDTIGAPAITPGLYKTFQSTMGVNGKGNLQNFDIGQFVLSGTPTGTNPTVDCLFLTNSPRTRDIQESEFYTLGFTNYYLADDILSEPYYVKYTFYDDQGLEITAVTYDNIVTNGGGPRVPCDYVYPATQFIYPSGNTDYNTLYVGAGPRNLDPILPANAVQYTVQLFGKFTGTTTPIQPSPTPTPTPSATPVPQCPTACYSYSVTNNSTLPCSYSYLDCNLGTTITALINGQTSQIIDCMCESSFISFCDLDLQYSSDCPVIKPCVDCYDVTISNNDPSLSINVSWYDCDASRYFTQSIPANTGINVQCACPNSITSLSPQMSYTVGSLCTPTPPTPTPTPSCAYKTWQISECSQVCVGGQCICGGSFLSTVYTDCSVTDIYQEGSFMLYTNTGLTNQFTGTYSDGSYIYEVVGSTVAINCLINGPC